MKTKHILGSLAIVAIAGLSSCDLTMLPETSVTPDLFFQTGSDLELWTNQYYTMFDEADGAAGTNADDMIDKSMGKVIEGTRNPQGSDGWSWTTLRSINEYMANSGRCADEAARLKYDGVARFFRAYFYFLKVRMFGDVPYYDQVIGSEDQALLNRPRDPRDYVMGKVLDDLRFAITNLPEKDDVTRLTKWAALGFATRIALYEGTFRKYHGIADYQKYLQFADSCGNVFINGSSYKLVSAGNEPYRDLFCADKADATEVVLARAYDFEGLSLSHGVQFVISNMQCGFTRRYMNHYLMADGSRFTDKPGYETMFYTEEVKNRDPRLAQTVLCPGYIQKGEKDATLNELTAYCGYQPIKFVSTKAHDGASKSTSDWPLMRAAEVYLNYAEAKAELGTLTQADLDKSLNKCRERANMPKLDMAAANANPDPFLIGCYPNVDKGANQGVILEVRRERTVEMVMEGLRQWDLFRWKEGKQMLNNYVSYTGIYFGGPGMFDMDGDGTPDVEIYADRATSQCDIKLRLNKDIYLDSSGCMVGYNNVVYGKDWNEDRDYLWPIPAAQRVLTKGALTQNPGWHDGLSL